MATLKVATGNPASGKSRIPIRSIRNQSQALKLVKPITGGERSGEGATTRLPTTKVVAQGGFRPRVETSTKVAGGGQRGTPGRTSPVSTKNADYGPGYGKNNSDPGTFAAPYTFPFGRAASVRAVQGKIEQIAFKAPPHQVGAPKAGPGNKAQIQSDVNQQGSSPALGVSGPRPTSSGAPFRQTPAARKQQGTTKAKTT